MGAQHVTFLFTDVEGSTRLLERAPFHALQALSRQQEIIEGAVVAATGRVFETLGDGIYAVFDSSQAAVTAALSAQLTLAGMDWGPHGAIRVRMAITAGPVQQRPGGRYSGAALFRCARLLALAHGGQTLVASAVAEGLEASSPNGLPYQSSLRDLGTFRLKDLDEPERVLQLKHPDLALDFPPLRTEEVVYPLPAPASLFIGRAAEVTGAITAVAEHRLVTLSGPGGAGKTRIALEVAGRLQNQYPDGVCFVALAEVAAAAEVAPALVRGLGARVLEPESAEDSLMTFLRTRRLLLVLDNLEHVTAAAPLLSRLLQGCPRLHVLATSRAALRVGGEHLLPVAAMDLPTGADPTREDLLRSDAVQLFLARSNMDVDPATGLDEARVQVITDICRRLDGLPLAIELAAARTDLFSPETIRDRLMRELPVQAGARDAPARQRTLEATLTWSYDLLDLVDQRVFAQLGVFAGDFRFDAVAEIVEIPERDPVESVSGLLGQSLLTRSIDSSGEPRFGLLRTVRAYALARLREAPGQEAATRLRHAQHYARLADQMAQDIRGSHGVSRLEAESANLTAALAFSREAGYHGLETDLCLALIDLWVVRGHQYGHLGESITAISTAARHADTDPAKRSRLHRVYAQLLQVTGDPVRAQAEAERAVADAKRAGDARTEVAALDVLAALNAAHGEIDAALAVSARSLVLCQRLDDDREMLGTLLNIANLHLIRGDYEAAVERGEQAMVRGRAFAASDDLVTQNGLIACRLNLAYAHLGRKNHSAASRTLTEGVHAARDMGDRIIVTYFLLGFAALAAATGQATAAARLCSAVDERVHDLGFVLEPFEARLLARTKERSLATRDTTPPLDDDQAIELGLTVASAVGT